MQLKRLLREPILFLTLAKVFRREGISQPGHATAEEFMGNPHDPSS